MKLNKTIQASSLLAALSIGLSGAASAAETNLPDPDGKPADMSKPVQVYLIMGQSNTLEMGKVNDALKEAYTFLADDSGKWTTRQDVRNVSVMVGQGVYRNDWLTMNDKGIGIEIGIGHQLGNAIDAPVMILKSSIGNRSLGWDLLPPGSPRYTYEGKEVAGYQEYEDGGKILPYVKGVSKVIGTKGKDKGKETDPWYAGKQYDDDVANAKDILANLDKYYPGAKSYEVAGILWWQGDKDMRNPAHAAMYEKNLVNLLKSLRKDFNAPKAAFVCASLGQTDESDTESGHGIILHSMKNFASGKYKDELGNNIGFVYTMPILDAPGSSSAHYSGNAKTYMNVGLAMGEEMKKLIAK